MKQESLEMFLECCLATIQSRMLIGNEFQADGAETAKALSVNRRRVRGVLKSLLIWSVVDCQYMVCTVRVSTTVQFREKLGTLKHTV